MYRFFEPLISPLLEAVDARTVVEVGSDQGFNTELLAEWCAKHDAHLHAIDPAPRQDVASWVDRWPGTLTFHRDLSLNALGEIDSPDVVCIDGDHNWYTVISELRLLADRAGDAASFPVTLLHDVGWPYGRRDLYYDPQTIPEAHRHPYAVEGMVRGSKRLSPDGFNAHLANAHHEGTPRNGVLTAVEDFVAERDGIELHTMSGINGVGIVLPTATREALGEQWEDLTGKAGLARLLDATEDDRLTAVVAVDATRRRLAAANEQAEPLKARISQLDDQLRKIRIEAGQRLRERDRASAQLEQRTTERDDARDELLARQRQVNQQELALAELERQNQDLRGQATEARMALQSERDELHRVRHELTEVAASTKRQQAAALAANEQLERARADAREQRQYALRVAAKQEQRLEGLLQQLDERDRGLAQHQRDYQALELGYRRLRERRSVRLALRVSSLARPFYAIRRMLNR